MGVGKRSGGEELSSVMSLFDAFLVMVVCVIVAGVMIVAFAVPADVISSTMNASAPYTSVPSHWKDDSSKELLLIADRLIAILLIVIGVGNFIFTAVRRQEVDDLNGQQQWQYQERF